MLLVLPTSFIDIHLVRPLADWIVKLGGAKKHRVLLEWSPEVKQEDIDYILPRMQDAFGRVNQMRPRLDAEDIGWPAGPNKLFWYAVQYAPQFSDGGPWWFFEGDCTPMRESWIDEVEYEYSRCGKPFMGVLQQSYLEPVPGQKIPAGHHLVGTAVYPSNVDHYTTAYQRNPRIAFDVAMQNDIVVPNHAAHTNLIQHNWLTHNYKRRGGGGFTCERKEGRLAGQIGYSLPHDVVPGTCAVLHGCKDLSLINLLNEDYDRSKQSLAAPAETPVENKLTEPSPAQISTSPTEPVSPEQHEPPRRNKSRRPRV